jgi:hypothetical protein
MSEHLELSTADAEDLSTTTSTTMKPHENDVLLGRGGKNNQHVGNENLRNLARQLFAQDYRVSRKKGKSNMSRDLVVQVRQLTPPGRYALNYIPNYIYILFYMTTSLYCIASHCIALHRICFNLI